MPMNQRKQFDALTSLKGLFILVIVFHNTMSIHPLFDSVPGSAFITLFGGSLGNSMFFILSGFLLSHSYRDQIMMHSISLKSFLLKRLKKLYPMYLITNIVALFLAILQYGISVINLKKIAFTLLLQIGGGLETGNPYNSPTWFISTLFLCYIVFFFISYHSKTTTHYCCAIAVGIIWGYTFMNANVMLPFCYPESGLGLMNFFIGCVLAQLYPLISQKTHKWLHPFSYFVLLFSFFLFFKYGVEIICGNVDTAFAFVICPLIFYLAMVDGPCSKILQQKPLVYLGKISISIFYWHLVIYNAFSIIFSLCVPGGVIQEKHYLLYVAMMIAWVVISRRWVAADNSSLKSVN